MHMNVERLNETIFENYSCLFWTEIIKNTSYFMLVL